MSVRPSILALTSALVACAASARAQEPEEADDAVLASVAASGTYYQIASRCGVAPAALAKFKARLDADVALERAAEKSGSDPKRSAEVEKWFAKGRAAGGEVFDVSAEVPQSRRVVCAQATTFVQANDHLIMGEASARRHTRPPMRPRP